MTELQTTRDSRPALSREQERELRERGWVRLPGAVEREAVERMAASVWRRLRERAGIEPDAPETWLPVHASIARPLYRAGVFDAIASPHVRAVLDQLLGEGEWPEPRRWGHLLMKLPTSGSWTLPHKSWHFDFRAPGGLEGLPGIQLFAFLGPVAPRGGGTLAVEGSHRLVSRIQQRSPPGDPGRSADVRKALRAVPWMRALWSRDPSTDRVERFMGRSESFDGVPLRVVELTGEPGDVIAMHGWLLHAGSQNCGPRARMVVTARLRLY